MSGRPAVASPVPADFTQKHGQDQSYDANFALMELEKGIVFFLCFGRLLRPTPQILIYSTAKRLPNIVDHVSCLAVKIHDPITIIAIA